MATRRDFLRVSTLSAAPALSGLGNFSSLKSATDWELKVVRFTGDGPIYSPTEYMAKLEQINQSKPIERDVYGKGGCVDELTKQFATLTGKEAAIYLASGTLAAERI